MTRISLELIQEKTLELGWDDVGTTTPNIPKEDIDAYNQWIDAGYHGDLTYMENAMRCNPDSLLPGAKSVIVFITYYKQPKSSFKKEAGLVASYARGRDYHNVHRKRTKKFIQWMESETGQKGIARGFSDSKPILEKALAVKAGLGWFGKNTLFIHRRFGTFVLLSGVITTLEIETPLDPIRLPRCGSCQKCIDACPTNALINPYLLDARKCLSYHTIESKKNIPPEINDKNPGFVFGCDICQDVCPHNMRNPISESSDFSEKMGVGSYLDLNTLNNMEKNPESIWGTPLKRKGVTGLKQSLIGLQKNKRAEDENIH